MLKKKTKLTSFDPAENKNAIVLIREEDGNWKGLMNKSGKVVEVRDIGPETALQLLLTHPGN